MLLELVLLVLLKLLEINLLCDLVLQYCKLQNNQRIKIDIKG